MFRAGADTATIPHSSKPRTLCTISKDRHLIMKIDIHTHTRKIKSGDAETRNIDSKRFFDIIKNTDVKILAKVMEWVLNNWNQHC